MNPRKDHNPIDEPVFPKMGTPNLAEILLQNPKSRVLKDFRVYHSGTTVEFGIPNSIREATKQSDSGKIDGNT